MDSQQSGVILFEQQPLPGMKDLDVDSLAQLLQHLSALSGDVRTMIERGAPSGELAQHFGYLDQNIQDLAGAAELLSQRLACS